MNSHRNEAKTSRGCFVISTPAFEPKRKPLSMSALLTSPNWTRYLQDPFIGAMDGHRDSIKCMAKNRNYLKAIFSGSDDGDIRFWDLASKYFYTSLIAALANSLPISWSPRCCTRFDSIDRWKHSCIMWK
ncbi:DDB1- and CUL4-associated factor 13-like isoform X1 [Durio zibethinus]|uniref:DDB1- and CUL4-associated factor 13-like isoform X1 n=1 Tax=Durio zibethinus TaxID=66656 RepID=A0A6P6AGR7_DURZI|nr:DDB1- and CUL4-associated factor 13-like isoform X1 [Durio zibethinus]